MTYLNSILQSKTDVFEKMDFMYDLFDEIKGNVNQILHLGPCNNGLAEKAAGIYYYESKHKLFKLNHVKMELEALPAVIANDYRLSLKKKEQVKSERMTEKDCIGFLSDAFLYGTGTCELFAMVGAYILATEYNVDLSIETIFSNQSHTYIRIHTDPEYIFDFWGDMVCQYDDDPTWNEVFGGDYERKDATYKTEITLNSEQLKEMGKRVFTEENREKRNKIQKTVSLKVAQLLDAASTNTVPGRVIGYQALSTSVGSRGV